MRFYRCCVRFNYSENDYLHVIRRYYSSKELNKLTVFYRSQEEYCASFVSGSNDIENLKYLLFWYDDFPLYDEHFSRRYLTSFDNKSLRFFHELFSQAPAFLETDCVPDFSDLSFRSNPLYRDRITVLDELYESRVKHRIEAELYSRIDSSSL